MRRRTFITTLPLTAAVAGEALAHSGVSGEPIITTMTEPSLSPALLEKVRATVEEDYPYLFDLFRRHNEDPEIGFDTVRTAARQLEALQKIDGMQAELFSRNGAVAVLKNGSGPVVLFRADMDALPVDDLRGTEWASKRKGFGHQCGHSMHSANLVGIARVMAALKNEWKGTAVFCCQPAEEGYGGADQMLRDGLYERFSKPDCCLSYHVSPTLPGGTVGVVPGRAFALAQMVDLTVKGVGGHGGSPHTAINPIDLSAHIISRFQTMIAREIAPLEPAILSVCAIHGGSAYAIIPSEVTIKITIRTFSEAVYAQIMAGMERICQAEAAASGLKPALYPVIKPRPFVTVPVFNDVALTGKVASAMVTAIGGANVRNEEVTMVAEDFGAFHKDGIPICMVWLGSVDPAKFDAAGKPKPGEFYPALHNEYFNPHPETTIRTGVTAMSAAMLGLFERDKR